MLRDAEEGPLSKLKKNLRWELKLIMAVSVREQIGCLPALNFCYHTLACRLL